MANQPALVAHYHEIGLKGRNRNFFEDALDRNLRRALRGTGYRKIRNQFGRVVIDMEPDGNVAEAARRAASVFGVVYIGVDQRVEPDLDAIGDAAVELATEKPFDSFAVRARWTYSNFNIKSQQINETVGQRIVDATGGKVDLKHPGATISIELFAKSGVIYRTRLQGPGGLPVGTSGRMLALLSGGIDSPVAAWRMARRGADVEFIHFHGRPYTDPSSIRQATELVEALTRYQLKSTLHLVPLGDVQRDIVMSAPANMRIILYRRAMMRIAERLADERRAVALITGDSLGQVASQTIENIRTVNGAIKDIEMFRPLIGMDKQEIVDQATAIGTYEISTRPHQDCCVLFEAREPATRANAGIAEKAERELDIDALTGRALEGVETLEFELPDP